MKTQQVKLTAEEIEEQKKYAQKYLDLINHELAYRDLVNVENVTKYTAAYKKHSEIAESGYVEMPVIGQ